MNKKRILAFSLILITLLCLYSVEKFIPDIMFRVGKDAYIGQNYAKAYEMFSYAVRLNKYNRDYRYYLVESMLKLKPTLEVQRELFSLSQSNLSDSADLIADRQISDWRKNILSNSGDNYITEVPFNDKILRWDVKKFPLKVFIETKTPNLPPAYYTIEIQKAFLQWQSSTKNFIRFEFVKDEKDANILVSINSSEEMKKCTQDNCKYTVAYTTPSFNGELLKKMDIFFYDTNNLGKPFSQREVYNTALHEIGHSLGIMGHSSNKDDLMYMENNEDKISNEEISDYELISHRDLNTLNLLYKLVPDITNTPMAQFNTSLQFFSPIVLGDEQEITTHKILEAENYINGAPELPNGYIDLAAAYAETKQYSKATEAFDKALSLCSNDNERFVVYYNYSIIYTEIQDWKSALKYAQMAKQIQPSADIDGIIAMINYKMGRKDLAKNAYNDALKKNPGNIIDSLNLAIIYIKEFNPVMAGHTLNNLVKANPDAANDSRVKSYGLLMFFFK